MNANNTGDVCFIALGSNLQNPKKQVSSALEEIAALTKVTILAQSSLHETKPVGGPEGQPNYINAVVKVRTEHSPHYLLKLLLGIEAKHGRERGESRNMPRTLDLDILMYGNKRISTKDLVVPHPRMTTRSFVLEPMYEIAPKVVEKILTDKVPYQRKQIFVRRNNCVEA